MKKYILALLIMALAGCAGQQPANPSLDNVPMPSVWAGKQTITLHNGFYSEAAAPGSASKITIRTTDHFASGHIDNQPLLATVLTTNPGGSGTFYDLYLFKMVNHKLAYVTHTALGDRIKINHVAITDNMVKVSMATHNPGTAMGAEPDLPLTKSFIFANQTLSEPVQPQTPPTTITPPPGTLAGKTFYWQSSLYGNDTQETPDSPSQYSITFNHDWTLAIQSDCNQTNGHFSLKGSKLTIKPTLPIDGCDQHSLSPIFIRDLADAVHVIFQKNNLYIDLIYDSGTLILTSQL